MISKTLTGITLNSYSPSLNLFYSINDTFVANSNIQFVCPLATLNTLLGTSITNINIENYVLYVRISNDISGSIVNNIVFETSYTLSTSNLIDSSFIVNISSITNKISHDYLCENMTRDEIYSLYKNYTIIFRIFTGTLGDKTTILSTDVIQDLNLSLNTAETGPYDVSLIDIDLISPTDFTDSERVSLYEKYIFMLGCERTRTFFPKNVSEKCPILILSHGMGQFTSAYDLYLATLASYGYICMCITSLPSPQNGCPRQFLATIEILRDNQSKIASGILSNIIDFNKINFSGHSRGGASATSAIMYLKNKSFISSIADYIIDISDIKSLVGFASAFEATMFENSYGIYNDDLIDINLQEDDLKYFDMYLGVPVFEFKGTLDTDSTKMQIFRHYGYSHDIKRNFHNMVLVSVDNFAHGTIASTPYVADEVFHQSYDIVFSSLSSRLETNTVYNTNVPVFTKCSSDIITFMSTSNFNSRKIKKLNYQGVDLVDNKILKDKRSGIRRSVFEAYNDIKYRLDDFSGITMSYAGLTGLTFTSIGFVYDFAMDNGITTSNIGITYSNAILTGQIRKYNSSVNGMDNDIFNGIINFNYKGLFLPIESNFHLGYTYQTPLQLEENDYFCLRGALKLIIPRYTGNTLDASCSLSLYDISNNTSTISSKTSDQTFCIPTQRYDPYSFDGTDFISSPFPTFVRNIYFRAGDFSLVNPSIDINNINQLMISFGPDYGSTFAHIVLDEFTVLKEM